MSTKIEYPQPLEIDAGEDVRAVIFTANNEYLISSGAAGVQVWRLKDGERVATMQVKVALRCVAVSKDGRFIAAGSNDGDVFVWDATNYEQVFAGKSSSSTISNIDFSPDSSRLVSAANSATIWDIAGHQKVQTLDHGGLVYAAKYSPQGDRIATATREAIRFWGSDGGDLLVDIKVELKPSIGLLWFSNNLFVKTYNKIKQIDTAPGSSTVSEWSVVDDPYSSSCIALPRHGKFIAHSSTNTVAFWDTATHTQFSPLQHTHDISSIACSSDGQLLAIAEERKVVIKVVSSIVFPSISEPDLDIDSVALNAWKIGQLADTEASLSSAITTSKGSAHHILAGRALVRARLGHWGAALIDAEESIKMERSVIGYIAMCVARVGSGETDEGCQVCDIAFLRCPSEHVSLFLLTKAVVLFMAGKHVNAMSRMDDLVTDVWVDPALHVVQAYMYLLLGNKYMESGDYDHSIQSFENARIKLGDRTRQPPLIVSLISGWSFDGLAITIQQRLCEVILAAGRAKEAGECMLRMAGQDSKTAELVMPWISDFKYRCYTKLEDLGDSAMDSVQYHAAISHYTDALSLEPADPRRLLMKRSNAWANNGSLQDALTDVKGWARLILSSGSWTDALAAAVGFTLERFTIYRAICEHLEETDRVTDAVACFYQMSTELAQKINGDKVDWTRDFKSKCCSKLENYGDGAANAKKYDEAVSQYTAALALDPARPQDLLVKRSKAHAEKGNWEDALNDANEVIGLNSSSPLGYERKYAALLGLERRNDAISAFETMLSKYSESSDPDIRGEERARHYVRPEQAREAIRASIQNAIRDSPLVLIHAPSGRMCNKAEQAAAFESTPAFTTLIASMTTHIDHARINQVVGEFYRYSTFSHTWEGNEPLYDKVIKIVVYKLEASHTHNKLQMFCKIVRDEGFNWAWSDTCCIDKGDHFILQEALVSMFKWYEGSSMTIVFLCDVDQLAVLGALTMSRWNSRGWTLQEYHASKVVRIYTKDWTPYLNLNIHNHKESPEIISEMEKATGVSAQALMALRPGLNDVREKLHLASTRQTTRVEDAAYSLLGIFSMSLPVTYGEGDKALGRLLSQLFMSSGDTSILAWTGTSGSFNSCLPTNIAVFSRPSTSYIPQAIPEAEMQTIITRLPASSHIFNLATKLYDQVDGLPTTLFAGQRMKLPCLAFKISSISPFHGGTEPAFRAQAGALGTVEIKSRKNLARLDSLYLILPWIDFLLDRQASAIIENVDDMTLTSPSFPGPSSIKSLSLRHSRSASLMGRFGRVFGGRQASDTASLSAASTVSPMKARMRILRFVARLKQQFGVLLLAPTRQNVAEYKRISTESLITARVQELTSGTLEEMIQGVRVLDVL